MRLVHVLGTRPNFVKMAPVIAAARERFGAESSVVVHTGQHYDRGMSEIFFEELGVPEPDHMLGVGSGNHGEQTARVLERLEPVLRDERPDLILVPGDVNSTLAAALCGARGTPTGWRPTRPLVGYRGSITAIKRPHGTMRSISARNFSRRVRFFFIAYSALAKLR